MRTREKMARELDEMLARANEMQIEADAMLEKTARLIESAYNFNPETRPETRV